MKKVMVACAVLAASCSGSGEVIPTPSPASNPTTSTPAINTTLLAAVATTEAPTTVPAPTTTEPEPTTIPPAPRPRATTTTEYLRPQTTNASASSLPYNGWAIPEYIVACETGGTFSWTAYNASGASGPYQIMPEWFGGELAMNQSHAAQHAMAAKIWNGGKGASNWSQCL